MKPADTWVWTIWISCDRAKRTSRPLRVFSAVGNGALASPPGRRHLHRGERVRFEPDRQFRKQSQLPWRILLPRDTCWQPYPVLPTCPELDQCSPNRGSHRLLCRRRPGCITILHQCRADDGPIQKVLSQNRGSFLPLNLAPTSGAEMSGSAQATWRPDSSLPPGKSGSSRGRSRIQGADLARVENSSVVSQPFILRMMSRLAHPPDNYPCTTCDETYWYQIDEILAGHLGVIDKSKAALVPVR
jgi:hypothetical protein